jgi:hypothetical protein
MLKLLIHSGEALVAQATPQLEWQTIHSSNRLRIQLQGVHQVGVSGRGKTVVFLGKHLHTIDENKYSKMCGDDEIKIGLFSAVDHGDLRNFVNTIEGRFLVLSIDLNKDVAVYSDRFGKVDVYFQSIYGGVAVATDLGLLPGNLASEGYDQPALAHTLTYYGYRPPKRHTIYAAVRRLGIRDVLTIKNGSYQVEKNLLILNESRQFTNQEHGNYKRSFLEYLEHSGSFQGNVVYLSSGWDSTSILAGLVEVFGSKNVHAITGRMLYSERSEICNLYEIERAQKFVDYYEATLDFIDLNYRDHGEEQFNCVKDIFLNNQLHGFTGVNHYLLAQAAQKQFGENCPVYAGEISDGAHNLGFSQYATIFHPSFGFREYSDKMASYLFGPTFIKMILDQTYEQDPIFQFMFNQKNSPTIDNAACTASGRMKQVLVSFFLRNGRFPFWSAVNANLLTTEGAVHYTEEMTREYIECYADITPKNIYAVLLDLYNSFHWQGSTVATLQVTAEALGLEAHLPYWDQRIQEILSYMPEEWGRGLDLRSTKYPLKKMLSENFNYPMDYQKGPHSYTYDVDHTFNHNNELLNHSSLTTGAKSLLKDRPYEEILSREFFDLNYAGELVESFVQGKEISSSSRDDLVALYLLSKTGWHS